METIRSDPKLIARCGLYCGSCRRFLKGGCPGCADNNRASWCKVRTCCHEHGYASCAECETHPDPRACRKFNNAISKLFGLFFNSNRTACVDKLRRVGPEKYADFMASRRLQSFPWRGPSPT